MLFYLILSTLFFLFLSVAQSTASWIDVFIKYSSLVLTIVGILVILANYAESVFRFLTQGL